MPVGAIAFCTSAATVSIAFSVHVCPISEPAAAIRGHVKIRHKHEPAAATVEACPGRRARITFEAPQRAITPGQAAVIYKGEMVLAGGWIE